MMKIFARRARGSERPTTTLADEYLWPIEGRKRAAARLVLAKSGAAERIATAPPGYLLAHDSGDIARHAALCSPLPSSGEVRAVATPGRTPWEWHLDIASRDQPGLLAAFTGVLAARGLDVMQAVIARWGDGAAMQAFVINSPTVPDVAALHDELESSLAQPLSPVVIGDADVTFDNGASPLYTRCEVSAADRPGLLHALSTAMAVAGADIHAARVTTTCDGVALDHFDLTDRFANKLDPARQDAIRAEVGVVVHALPTSE